MPVNAQYNLFGKKVSQTYHNLLQSGSDGKFYDGDGNEVIINATIPDIYATTGSNIFRGDQTITGSLTVTGSTNLLILTASGLNYPSADNGEFSFIQTDGNGNLSLQYVNTLYEIVYNAEATSLVKGTPVYISGSQGANSKAYIADAGNPLKMPVVYVTADTIAPGDTGRAIALGLITGVDTTGYPGGTEIYIAVGGGWTSTRPTGSAIVQILGYVTKEGSGGQGVILNPGPSNLPNLLSGSVWVGNSGSVPVAVLTSSLSVASASWATNALTASFAPDYVLTSSTGSMLAPYVLTSQTSSMTVLSSSFALTASYVSPSPSAGLIYFMTGSPASVSAGVASEQVLTSITIPANVIQVGDRLEIFYNFSKVGTNAVSSYRVKISGSGTDGTLLNNGANQGATVLGLTSQNLYRVLSTSSMVGSSQFFGGAATVGTTINYTGSSLTGSNTFYFNAIRNSLSDTITLNDCYIKILR